METKTKQFLEWFGTYAEKAKIVEVAGAQLTPELRSVLGIDGNYGKYHGVVIHVIPSYRVVE